VTVRVLIADDQAPFRRAAGSVLRSVGFEVVGEATSGEEAIVLARVLRPDLVLMDIGMKGIGGLEATRSITAADPGVITILVSTYRESDLPPGAATCGAEAYLHKAEFGVDALRRLLGRSL
jgi:DNA-binding NarL/FixJ family response regulator